MPTYHAHYCCVVGNKKTNTLLANAGLGVKGAYVKKQIEIDWKPGEEVTKERATALCPVIKQGLEQQDFDCQSVTLVKVWATVR